MKHTHPPSALAFFALALLSAAGARAQESAPRILLLGSPNDAHPAGTHEYARSLRLLEGVLEDNGLDAQVAPDGWDDALPPIAEFDALLCYTRGSDHGLEEHPLFQPERLEAVLRAAEDGLNVGLVHWSTFAPNDERGDALLELVGGHFDYQSGEGPRGWASRIATREWEVSVASDEHPIARGVSDHARSEEFYTGLRFREADPRRTPLWTVEEDGATQTVAWAIERANGGRGFATTGGHFGSGWFEPEFQRLLANACLWLCGLEVPAGGAALERGRLLSVGIASDDEHPAHDAQARAAALRELLERDPHVRVVDAHPEHLAPLLPALDVVVWNHVDWNGEPFSLAGRAALRAWVEGGGGLVLSHFANGAHHRSLPGGEDHHWSWWHEQVSLRSWDHAGDAAHDAYGPFVVEVSDLAHPITEGQTGWTTSDELYHSQSGDRYVRALVLGRSQATREDAPLAWTQRVGAGRVFQCLLGHDADALLNSGTARLMQRGTVWCAGAPQLSIEHPVSAAERELEVFVPDPAWTPRGSTRPGAAPFERESEEDWVDARIEDMDHGPAQAGSFLTPGVPEQEQTERGLALRVGADGAGAVLFDTELLRWSAAWMGERSQPSPVRFGLLRKPTIGGEPLLWQPERPGWMLNGSLRDPRANERTPLPEKLARYSGHWLVGERTVLEYRIGDRTVLESPWLVVVDGVEVFLRDVVVSSGDEEEVMMLPEVGGSVLEVHSAQGDVGYRQVANQRSIVIQPSREARFRVMLSAKEVPAVALPFPGDELWSLRPAEFSARWGAPLETRGELGEPERGFALDTLSLPDDNPWGALLYASGVGFLPDGRVVVCTIHGDVWTASGVGAELETLRWQRFATGLYQPLGLEVVDGSIFVLGRDRLTRLHDLDGDGEADRYENFCDLLEIVGGDHLYAMDLARDPEGWFYFNKSGDASSEHGGAVVRISRDGRRIERFASGRRHANGIGVSPEGVVTSADNEGQWVPSTRLDVVAQGGFYGYAPAFRGEGTPTSYDPPLLWLPREADNSAGGQVWVPESGWAPALAGRLLHFSFGRCTALLVGQQRVDAQLQGWATTLPARFLSGAMRGRFSPHDGQLYVVGSDGWQTAARADGSLQRLRWVGGEFSLPVDFRSTARGFELRFETALDAERLSKDSFAVSRWNYRWSGRYGSREWSLEDPERAGRDAVAVESVRLDPSGRSVHVELESVEPCMQLAVDYELVSASGAPLSGTLWASLHRVPAE